MAKEFWPIFEEINRPSPHKTWHVSTELLNKMAIFDIFQLQSTSFQFGISDLWKLIF